MSPALPALDAPHQFPGILDSFAQRSPSPNTCGKKRWRTTRWDRRHSAVASSGMPPICVVRELKAPTNKPTDDQLQFGADMSALGHHWFWVQSVGGLLAKKLRDLNVPLRFTAPLLATDADLKLAAPEMRKSGPRSYKPRLVLAKPSSVNDVTRARAGGVLI